jgi:AraC-like DNA-binding protein
MQKRPILETTALSNSPQPVLAFKQTAATFAPYWHYHPAFELTLITRGSGIRFVGDSIENYQAGDLVLIGKHLPHQWVSDHHASLQEAIVIQFDHAFFQGQAVFHDLNLLLQRARMGLHFPQVSLSMLRHIHSMLSQAAVLQLSTLIAVLFQLSQQPGMRVLSDTDKFNVVMSSEKEQRRINQVIGFILSRLDQELSVPMLARQFHMTPQSFCRWFRQHTGSSFVTFRNKSRIQSACHYLLTTHEQVSAIACRVGFADISHFNRTFKTYKGMSPLAFKKQHLDTPNT